MNPRVQLALLAVIIVAASAEMAPCKGLCEDSSGLVRMYARRCRAVCVCVCVCVCVRV
jgi:hypothetical protein